MRLNLHLLRVFHTVASEGSFSAAARALHISQPAVSKAVSELERQLALTLIERSGGRPSQRLALTDAGAALDAHARAIFAFERAAVDDLTQRSDLRQGQLVIGASTTIASYWLPRYLQRFSAQWPDIALKVVVANTHSITEDLFDCRLDLALVEGPVHVEGVVSHPWKEERLVIVASPSFPTLFGDKLKTAHPTGTTAGSDVPAFPGASAVRVSTSDLADCTWLVREEGSGTREVSFGLLSKQGMQPKRSMEIGSNEGIARAVASGLGVAMLPFAVVEDLLLLGRLMQLQLNGDTAAMSRRLYRLERKHRSPSPAACAFLDILRRDS